MYPRSDIKTKYEKKNISSAISSHKFLAKTLSVNKICHEKVSQKKKKKLSFGVDVGSATYG